MGIFSTNRYDSLGNYNVEAAQGYNGEIGAAIAMIEGHQNDLALFNGIIANDFHEACLIQEGASEEEIYVVQEGALASAWEKLKAFFKKLWEKIKGIFHNFIAKMDSVFMKDSKAFYNKYYKEINKKSDWEDFKVEKFRKVRTANTYSLEPNSSYSIVAHNGDNETESTLKKAISDFDKEVEFTKKVKDLLGNSHKELNNVQNSSEFKEEYFNCILEDEDTIDDWNSGDITSGNSVGAVLQDRKILSNLERANKKLEEGIVKIIKDIDKAKDNLSKVSRDDYKGDYTGIRSFDYNKDTGVDKTDMNKNVGHSTKDNDKIALNKWQLRYDIASKEANIMQDVILAYTSASVECVKFICAQARRVFAAAVAWNPKKKNESAEIAAFVGDAAFVEATQLIDTMYYED